MIGPDEFKKVLEYIDHKSNCDFVQPMWHKGPCDCGLFALFEKIDRYIGDCDSLVASLGFGIINSPAYQRWKNRAEHEL